LHALLEDFFYVFDRVSWLSFAFKKFSLNGNQASVYSGGLGMKTEGGEERVVEALNERTMFPEDFCFLET